MKYAVEMGSGVMMYIPGDSQTHGMEMALADVRKVG
jgi:hypothetical protein